MLATEEMITATWKVISVDKISLFVATITFVLAEIIFKEDVMAN